jgi:hypothetical protein
VVTCPLTAGFAMLFIESPDLLIDRPLPQVKKIGSDRYAANKIKHSF